MSDSDRLFLGVRGTVLCFDRRSGERRWDARLRGRDFVNLLVDGDLVFAHTGGWLFCLSAATGALLWSDGLSGFGYGVATLATAGMPGGQLAAMLEQMERDRPPAQSPVNINS